MSEQTLRYHLKFGVDEYEHVSPAQLQYCVNRIRELEAAITACNISLKSYESARSTSDAEAEQK